MLALPLHLGQSLALSGMFVRVNGEMQEAAVEIQVIETREHSCKVGVFAAREIVVDRLDERGVMIPRPGKGG